MTARPPLKSTAHRRAQSTQSDASKEVSAEKEKSTADLRPAENPTGPKKGGTAKAIPKQEVARSKAATREIQRKFFIDLMRTVPHPVAIVTARKQDVKDDAQGTVAATVSSFNTVSLHPDLVMSFNLKSDSITYQTILDSKHFAITFPQMNAAGANLTHSFTRGNEPSPFSTKFPDHPTPRTHRWLENPLPGLNYNPPFVALDRPDDFEKSGFAFAIVCEYQTSTTIGDHVIVTGRLSPTAYVRTVATGWGSKAGKHLIESHEITLAHVHGAYSNTDTGLGFVNLLKMDDQSLGKQRESLSKKIEWCRNRLEGIAAAQMIQQGISSAIVIGEKAQKNHLRFVTDASKMKPELLVQYERYYMQRLQNLELQAQQSGQDGAKSTSEETTSEEEVEDVPYGELLGHQQLFVRNKMLLTMEEIEEEIALYTVRLTALRLKAEENATSQAPEDGSDSVEELAPEESKDNSALQPQEEGISRNLQLRRYFMGRIHLLQHAKTRKVEHSRGAEKLGTPVSDKVAAAEMRRFIGINKIDTLQGLKTKYRRYQYQITEAKLSLMGLEMLPERHPNVPILRERIKYFEPRRDAITKLIQERAKSSSIKDLLLDNFQPPPMRNQDEKGATIKVPKKKPQHLRVKEEEQEPVKRKLVREITYEHPLDTFYRTGESTDQLDHPMYDEFRGDTTKAAVKQAAQKMPLGVPLQEKVAREFAAQPRVERPPMTPEEEAAEDLRQMQEIERRLMRRNANQVRDYLTLRNEGDGDGDMPSPEDFIDVNKMREERLRREEEERDSRQGTSS